MHWQTLGKDLFPRFWELIHFSWGFGKSQSGSEVYFLL